MSDGFLTVAGFGACMIGIGVYVVGLYLLIDALLNRLDKRSRESRLNDDQAGSLVCLLRGAMARP